MHSRRSGRSSVLLAIYSCAAVHPTQLLGELEQRVLALRAAERLGPVRLAHRLQLAPATVGRVLRRHRVPLLRHVDPTTGVLLRGRRASAQRYEYGAPGGLLHGEPLSQITVVTSSCSRARVHSAEIVDMALPSACTPTTAGQGRRPPRPPPRAPRHRSRPPSCRGVPACLRRGPPDKSVERDGAPLSRGRCTLVDEHRHLTSSFTPAGARRGGRAPAWTARHSASGGGRVPEDHSPGEGHQVSAGRPPPT